LWRQRLIAVCAALLRSSLVQITIQPQAKTTAKKKRFKQKLASARRALSASNSLSSANRKALHVSFDEVHILASPMEHLEAGVKLVEQGLTGAVKVIRHMQ